ncbi:hypothetical protein XPA_005300 [Xanthoria parietina]
MDTTWLTSVPGQRGSPPPLFTALSDLTPESNATSSGVGDKANVESEYTYDFWSNHYSIDLAINQTLQSSLKHLNIVPAIDSIEGMADPNTIFRNMNMRATVICLHQAAVVQANKSFLPATLIAESENRTLTAAREIATIMRLIRTSIHLSKVTT